MHKTTLQDFSQADGPKRSLKLGILVSVDLRTQL